MYAVLWWTLYTAAAVWAMRWFPGVDFLAPGLVICLQDENYTTAFWLGLAWTLLAEGVGGLHFGFGPAWYGGVAALYFGGRWLFEAKNLLFMCLLGLALGAWHYLLCLLLAGLQDLEILSRQRLVWEGLLQAGLFPVVWTLLGWFMPRRLRKHEQVV